MNRLNRQEFEPEPGQDSDPLLVQGNNPANGYCRSFLLRLFAVSIILVLAVLSGQKGMAQNPLQQADSLRIKEQKEKTEVTASNQNQKNAQNQNVANSKGNSAVKRLRSGRPDLSKSRGARPPSIIRPSGSGVPKGVGKPAGVGRKGGR